MKFKNFPFVILPFVVLLVGCATYYQKNLLFNENFAQGDIEEANKILDKNKKAATQKNRLLYFLQKGVVLQMMDDYDASNQFFEQAYFFTEDYRKSYSLEAASLLVNPMVKPYVGEDHELVLMHYFMALNYLRLNQYDEALVECRRINNKLNLLNDRYENKKNRYRRDAFALNLMGIAYEAANDINNAFIAYRNSYEAYEEDYQRYFSIEPPLQLKKDLLRTAYLNGFNDELERFERKMEMKYEHQEKNGAELIFFWHNGLGPVKSEWSLNFALEKGVGGTVVFKNDDYGFNFPFPLPTSDKRSGGLSNLKFVRVTFPKYQERRSYFQNGEIFSDGEKYPLEIGEDVNKIARLFSELCP